MAQVAGAGSPHTRGTPFAMRAAVHLEHGAEGGAS